MSSPRSAHELRVLLLVAAVQLVNVLDFMMVMPLGPDFAKDLGIPNEHLGYIGGSYTAAAAIAGILASRFLDRFDRRSALGVSMLGLVLATAAGGLAQGMPSLIAARVMAGCFGGPASSLSLAIVADVVPPERRGKALGLVMSAFAVVSVIGVPAGLELATLGTWRTPFFAVAGLGAAVAASAIFLMPSLRGHLTAGPRPPDAGLGEMLRRPEVRSALVATACTMISIFALVPNLSAYVQENLGYPRSQLGLLYMASGAASFAVMRVIGGLVDRLGATVVSTAGTALIAATIFVGFARPIEGIPVLALYIGFMVSSSVRSVPLSALTSRVPASHERARFMSLQSAVQHMSAAIGAIAGAQLLTELPDKRLDGMPRVATASIVFSLFVPFFIWAVEARVKRRESAAAGAGRALAGGARAEGAVAVAHPAEPA